MHSRSRATIAPLLSTLFFCLFPGAVGAQWSLWSQASPGVQGAAEPGDQFGGVLAVGDFDGDGKDDLAVGVPKEDLGSDGEAGAVNVLYGSNSGVNGVDDDLITMDNLNTTFFSATAGARFGSALAVGDFDGDQRDDLVISAPGASLFGDPEVGAVFVVEGSPSGLDTAAIPTLLIYELFDLGEAATGDQMGVPP